MYSYFNLILLTYHPGNKKWESSIHKQKRSTLTVAAVAARLPLPLKQSTLWMKRQESIWCTYVFHSMIPTIQEDKSYPPGLSMCSGRKYRFWLCTFCHMHPHNNPEDKWPGTRTTSLLDLHFLSIHVDAIDHPRQDTAEYPSEIPNGALFLHKKLLLLLFRVSNWVITSPHMMMMIITLYYDITPLPQCTYKVEWFIYTLLRYYSLSIIVHTRL